MNEWIWEGATSIGGIEQGTEACKAGIISTMLQRGEAISDGLSILPTLTQPVYEENKL